MKINKQIQGEISNHKFEKEIRKIRVLLTKKEGIQVIQFVSSVKSDSFTSLYYKIAKNIARLKRKTILLNFDVDNTNMVNICKPNGIYIGIEEYFLKNVEIEKLIISRNEYFDFVVNKDVVKNSSDLLISHQLESLFKYLRNVYDYVLVVTPSLEKSYDALTISKYTDGLVYFKDNNRPNRSMLKEHAKILNELNEFKLGIIITNID